MAAQIVALPGEARHEDLTLAEGEVPESDDVAFRVSARQDDPVTYPDHIDHLRIHANGLNFYLAAAGPEDGPLLILLHGFPEFSYAWRRYLGPIAKLGFRVVAPDQRGYGLSDKPRGVASYRLDLLASDVAEIGTALGAGRFCVVGHDWGGIVAWRLLQSFSSRVKRAVIMNAPHPETLLPEMMSHPMQLLRSTYAAFFQLPWIPEQILGWRNGIVLERALLTSSRTGAFSAEDLKVYRDAWSQPRAMEAMLNWYRAMRLRSDERRISVPVRILWGDRDSALNASLAERAALRCEDCTVRHFSEATHWLHHEFPQEISRELTNFLAAGNAGLQEGP